ncbi:MAG: uridine kinase [Verrucomicrobiia bacterium]
MSDLFKAQAPRLVAITGWSGAGKSWLAGQLQERLGKEAGLLRLDDFYRDRSHLSAGRRNQVNFDHPRSIDWPLFERVLRRCRRGLPMQVPRYDFARHARSGFVWWRPCAVVLVEGLWLLQRASIRRLFAWSVFIECDRELCLKRRLMRDVSERGRSDLSVRSQFREHVAPMAERFVQPQAARADWVVQSPLSTAAVDEIEARIRQRLAAD